MAGKRTGLLHYFGHFAPRFVPSRHLFARLHAPVVQHGPPLDLSDQLFLHVIVVAGPPPPSPFLSPRYGCCCVGMSSVRRLRRRQVRSFCSSVTLSGLRRENVPQPNRRRCAAKRRADHQCRGTRLPQCRGSGGIDGGGGGDDDDGRDYDDDDDNDDNHGRRRRRRRRRWRWFASAAVRLRVHCIVPRRRLLRARRGAAQLKARPPTRLRRAVAAERESRVRCSRYGDGPNAARATTATDKIDCRGGRRQRRR